MNKELLNTRELSEYLDINEKKIYSLIMDKGLPATKVTVKGWLTHGLIPSVLVCVDRATWAVMECTL